MAVRRAGSGLVASGGIPKSSGGLEESQNAGETKRTWPCSKRRSDTFYEKMTECAFKMLTNLHKAKRHGAEKQSEPNIRREHATA
jgi:hypothetical protein